MLTYYLRNLKTRVPYGVVVAKLDEQKEIRIGWSLCRKGDRFSKKIGKELAAERMADPANIENLREKMPGFSTPLRVALVKILDRAARYYKQWDHCDEQTAKITTTITNV